MPGECSDDGSTARKSVGGEAAVWLAWRFRLKVFVCLIVSIVFPHLESTFLPSSFFARTPEND
jgi:hypothetical protein